MPSHYADQSFIDIDQRFQDACDWLQSLGVRVPGTRVAEYRRLLSELGQATRAGHPESVIKGPPMTRSSG